MYCVGKQSSHYSYHIILQPYSIIYYIVLYYHEAFTSLLLPSFFAFFTQAIIPESIKIANERNIDEAILLLLNLEKKCRVNNDFVNLKEVCLHMIRLCRTKSDWAKINSTLAVINKRYLYLDFYFYLYFYLYLYFHFCFLVSLLFMFVVICIIRISVSMHVYIYMHIRIYLKGE